MAGSVNEFSSNGVWKRLQRQVTKNVREMIVCGGMLVTCIHSIVDHVRNPTLIRKGLRLFVALLWKVSDGVENAIHSMVASVFWGDADTL